MSDELNDKIATEPLDPEKIREWISKGAQIEWDSLCEELLDECDRRSARIAKLEKAIRENGRCARPSCCDGKTYTRIGLSRIKTDVCSRCSGTNLEPWAREALEES